MSSNSCSSSRRSNSNSLHRNLLNRLVLVVCSGMCRLSTRCLPLGCDRLRFTVAIIQGKQGLVISTMCSLVPMASSGLVVLRP